MKKPKEWTKHVISKKEICYTTEKGDPKKIAEELKEIVKKCFPKKNSKK